MKADSIYKNYIQTIFSFVYRSQYHTQWWLSEVTQYSLAAFVLRLHGARRANLTSLWRNLRKP